MTVDGELWLLSLQRCSGGVWEVLRKHLMWLNPFVDRGSEGLGEVMRCSSIVLREPFIENWGCGNILRSLNASSYPFGGFKQGEWRLQTSHEFFCSDFAEVTLHSEKLKFIWLFTRFFVTLSRKKEENDEKDTDVDGDDGAADGLWW